MLDGSLPIVRAVVDGLRAYVSASVVIAILIGVFGVQRIDSSMSTERTFQITHLLWANAPVDLSWTLGMASHLDSD